MIDFSENNKNYDLINGENLHQKAELYKIDNTLDFDRLSEYELTYANILNMSSAVSVMSEFYDVECCVFVQNGAPSAVALGKDINDAYQRAFDCDPISSFGASIGFTQELDDKTALHLSSLPIALVIAPAFSEKALELLLSKKDITVIKLNTPLNECKGRTESKIKITPFGVIREDFNNKELDKETFKVVSKAKAGSEQLEDAIFAWKIAKYAKSNACVIAKDFKTISISQGAPSCVEAVEHALDKSCDSTKDAVLATDVAIPATDSLLAAIQGRISLVIQSGGNAKEKEVVAIADKYKLVMVTTGFTNIKY